MTRTTPYVRLLRETEKSQCCQIEKIALDGRIGKSAIAALLQELQDQDLMTLDDGNIIVTREQRMRIAMLAVAQGSDPEVISRELRWQEFEGLAERVLNQNGYDSKTHFVFKHAGRRFEIDVLAGKEPLLLCIDCKHWRYGWAASRIAAAVRNQLVRVTSLSQCLREQESRLGTSQWKSIRMLPVLLTLADVSSRIVNGVPTVSALRFGTFLSEIDPWVEQLGFVDLKRRQTKVL